MKPEMKNQLKQMRKEGYGYKKIAKELGLTLSVVRYACIKMGEEDLLEGHCEKCGLKIKSIKGKRERDFVLIDADGIGGTNTKKKLTKRLFISMYVNGAIKSSQLMVTKTEFIAAMIVISSSN